MYMCKYIHIYIYHVPSLDDTSERERQRRPAQNQRVDQASRYIVLYLNIHQCTYMYVYAAICRYIDLYHVPSLDDTSEGERQRRPAQNRRVEHLSIGQGAGVVCRNLQRETETKTSGLTQGLQVLCSY